MLVKYYTENIGDIMINNKEKFDSLSHNDTFNVNFNVTKFNNNYNSNLLKNSEPFEVNGYFSIQNRRYLGSKFKLLEFIAWVVENNCHDIFSFADIFAGTGTVANIFNSYKTEVIVNDLLYSNYLIYNAFFNDSTFSVTYLKELIKNYNFANVRKDNYFSENFADSFFTKDNARKIGFIRDNIELLSDEINFREKAILITSLIYAADKVANTCGHYDAYRRKLDTTQNLNLLFPKLPRNESNWNNSIFNEDANKLVKKISPDLVYIDPPYNSRQYGDTYHLLENLAEWKKPDVFGVAKKMKDRKKTKSDYCTVKAPKAFENLINNIDSKYVLVSYNNMAQKGSGRSNAKISDKEILDILTGKGKVKVFYSDYNAFTTGKTNIVNHKELLYLCEVNK